MADAPLEVQAILVTADARVERREVLATTDEDIAASSPAKLPGEERSKVDSQDIVAATAMAAGGAVAGVASDLDSPIIPDGLAITGTHTPITAMGRRTTHPRTTPQWLVEL